MALLLTLNQVKNGFDSHRADMQEILEKALNKHEYFKNLFYYFEIIEDNILVFIGDDSIGFEQNIVENPLKLQKALNVAAKAYKYHIKQNDSSNAD